MGLVGEAVMARMRHWLERWLKVLQKRLHKQGAQKRGGGGLPKDSPCTGEAVRAAAARAVPIRA